MQDPNLCTILGKIDVDLIEPKSKFAIVRGRLGFPRPH